MTRTLVASSLSRLWTRRLPPLLLALVLTEFFSSVQFSFRSKIQSLPSFAVDFLHGAFDSTLNDQVGFEVRFHSLFGEFRSIVERQGEDIDTVQWNAEQTARDLEAGAQQLETAARHQRRARRTCLTIILGVACAVVFLANLNIQDGEDSIPH
ncbi:hypothetical protein C8R45DRAFT_933923 [Mycena sanguinolenta]|nr:hypothetical protein C8R45DRAFT_933923 [Mycena sanguinolenta]